MSEQLEYVGDTKFSPCDIKAEATLDRLPTFITVDELGRKMEEVKARWREVAK